MRMKKKGEKEQEGRGENSLGVMERNNDVKSRSEERNVKKKKRMSRKEVFGRHESSVKW